jgi:hypothetical protein
LSGCVGIGARHAPPIPHILPRLPKSHFIVLENVNLPTFDF